MNTQIKCLKCGTILESKSRYDFNMCKCINRAFVDGGPYQPRIGADNLKMIEIITKKKGNK